MNITEVTVRKTYTPEQSPRVRAICSITLDGMVAIHEIKVVAGKERLFVSMPSRRDEEGNYRDIIHPIHRNFRQELEYLVLEAYQKAIAGGKEYAQTI